MYIRKVTLLTVALLIISGCDIKRDFFSFKGELETADSSTRIDKENYYKPGSYVRNYQDVVTSNPVATSQNRVLPSQGRQKMLVLPVSFQDYQADLLDGNEGSDALVNIKNAFFGRADTTNWHSVSSFYHTSSYGKLLIEGEVAPWYELPAEYNVATIKDVSRNNEKLRITGEILRLALRNYILQNPTKIAEFDQDNDGIIDSAYVVYAHPHNNERNNIFWAFATNNHTVDPFAPYQANAYSWTSYHFMNVGKFKKPDAHTFIHETAHIMGIVDYYNTNQEASYSPLGGFDIMDYTMGDHSGLTKMMLNWARPYVVTAPGQIVIRPFTTSGDLILIKNEWNGSSTDEYLLLEYYTPTHLNELDSRQNAPFKLPRKNGLKVYHVDARTVYKVNNGYNSPYVYTNDVEFDGTKHEMLAHSNSTNISTTPIEEYVLYKLIEPREQSTIIDGGKASANSLFKTGDDFGISNFQTFEFNDGNALPYNFEVQTMDNINVSIKFSDR